MVEIARNAPGMVALKGDLSDPGLIAATEAACGAPPPGPLGASVRDGRGALWMAPDELLLLVEDAPAAARDLTERLEGTHHLALDVSDARAVFALSGPEGALREVLSRLTPADMAAAAFGPATVRRTRLAQVPAGLWWDGGAAQVMCFRSVADYVERLLRQAARAPRVGLH
ncbi:MAG: sarcosine oxidase subunit gamma [Paracoccaceae bacterium]